jgi:plastocyanin
MSGLGFQPATLTAHVGERITWANDDLIVHTVTAADHRFDSGDVPGGGSWSWVAHHKGVIHYSCRYHPNMVGTVTVN